MKSQIGNTLCFISLFLIFNLYGCRTVKNSVTKEKTLTEKSELNIDKFDSISKIDKQNKIETSFNSNWFEFWNKYDASFNGLSNEDTFELTFTENGFTAKGKGSVNLKSETNKKDSTVNDNIYEIVKENSDVRKNHTTEIKSEENEIKIDKNKQNKSIGLSFNITIIIAIGVIIVSCLFWKFGLPKFNR